MMNHDTNTGALPELTADFLRSSHSLIDNIFADLWKQITMQTQLNRSGFHKRSGVAVGTGSVEWDFAMLSWES